MATTLQNLRDTFYDILREEQDVSAYPLSLVDLLLNAAQQKICFWRVVNPLTKEEVRKWQLPFLQTDYFYTSVADITLADELETSDVIVTVASTTWWEDATRLYINGNIVSCTGYTATTFTGVTNVLFDHPTWSTVWYVYTLPTDFASSLNVIYNHRYKMECKQYDDIFEDINSNKWIYSKRADIYGNTLKWVPFYTIKDNQYLIIFNQSESNKSIRLRYEKQATTLSASTDTATITNDIYAQTTITYLAVGEMLYNRWEENRAAELLNFALWQVREMYSYYNDSSLEKISGTKYKMAKGKMNI